jgi:hypothetical protein
VLAKHPKAQLTTDFFGNYIVLINDEVVAEEYLFPETTDPEKAWEYALLALRTTQNFNRTHPLKLDLSSDEIENKLVRIHNRKYNALTNLKK